MRNGSLSLALFLPDPSAPPNNGQETQVHADAGYIGVEKRSEINALNRPINWQIRGKRGQFKKLAEGPEKEALKAVEKAKASVRAFVEHPCHILKNIFRLGRQFAQNCQRHYLRSIRSKAVAEFWSLTPADVGAEIIHSEKQPQTRRESR